MATLGRLALKRIEVFVPPVDTPWSRGLWGVFLPDRRGRVEPRPPGMPERRVLPTTQS